VIPPDSIRHSLFVLVDNDPEYRNIIFIKTVVLLSHSNIQVRLTSRTQREVKRIDVYRFLRVRREQSVLEARLRCCEYGV
jgi:hypothetical protein